ncbi:MAG: outer membrane protein assembly factor BamB [Gammaproteobacteria bacterium]
MRRVCLIAVFALAGCGLFGGGDEGTSELPAALTEFDPTLTVRKLWSASMGGDAKALRLGLSPATDGARIFVGSHNGQAAAFDAGSGQRHWAVRTELALAAGPSYGDGIVVFGTSDGELLALDAETGQERWLQEVGGEVLAPPSIGSSVVVVRTVDGRLRGFSVDDGRDLWSVEQTVPSLTMRGNTAPYVTGTIVVTGFDNGRLGAYEISSGDPRWEVAVATPTGRTEIERLVDISAGLQVVGNDVYAVSYHGRAVSVALETGLLLWQQELSSHSGLGADWNSVYVTDEFSEVVALDRNRGTPKWRQNVLRLRDVTAPTPYGNAIVVGDLEGYLHWLNPSDGNLLARVRAASQRIGAAPLVVGQNLFAQADDGTVAAFTVVVDE